MQAQAQDTTDVAIKEALLAGAATEQAVQRVIEEKLPIESEARQYSQSIMDFLRLGLKNCENSLTTVQQIPDYKKCVETARGLAMASMGELAGQHWSSSGAARLGSFF